jgi:hypothetical protein
MCDKLLVATLNRTPHFQGYYLQEIHQVLKVISNLNKKKTLRNDIVISLICALPGGLFSGGLVMPYSFTQTLLLEREG